MPTRRIGARAPAGCAWRLRQLAIHLERTLDVREWPVLERVYRAALEADPDHARTWISWALARYDTDTHTPEVLEACVRAGRRAVALAPDDGHLLGIHGQILYEADHTEEAEATLRQAIALGHGGWPHLWLAHLLHDQHRWAEAAAAYAAIPAANLPEPARWRIQLAREQRAATLLRAGRRDEAVAAYAEVLDRYTRALDAGLDEISSPVLAAGPPEHLLRDGPRLPELAERTEALRVRLEAAG
ncbi:MAG: hypothetical protein KC656_22110 [Myxococcales bacterium]|nr:hypothetical protein [Myxococcales bacterium]